MACLKVKLRSLSFHMGVLLVFYTCHKKTQQMNNTNTISSVCSYVTPIFFSAFNHEHMLKEVFTLNHFYL